MNPRNCSGVGRIHLIHLSDPTLLLQVGAHQPEGRVVPLQGFVAVVVPGMVLHVDRASDGRVPMGSIDSNRERQ
jgi:hypothetical protein